MGTDGEKEDVGCGDGDRVGGPGGPKVGVNSSTDGGGSDGVGVPGPTVSTGSEAAVVCVGASVYTAVATSVRVCTVVAVAKPEGEIVRVGVSTRAGVAVAANCPKGGSVRYGLSLPHR